MTKSKWLLAAMAFSSVALIPLPASAQVYLEIAPPAPRHEVIPAPRPGHVWQPGYWEWRDGHHVWVRGHWLRERRGMYWHPSRWEVRDGRWFFEPGGWYRERYAYNDYPGRRGPYGDRDRDGIPNAYDRDRDGDGVRDRRDEYPNNPRRW